MPTVHSMELSRPQNWQDFETMVRDAQAQRWNSTTLQKNGRPGQDQNGVDIYGPDDIGRRVGIQCKRCQPPLKLDVVIDEIGKAETFSGPLTTLFIATTADYDSKLQQQVRLLSDKRVAADKFAVALLFWDDIVSGLVLNPAVFSSHYPQVVLSNPSVADKERLLAALELGYYGADLWEYVVLTFGEYGWMAQSDPDELIATLRMLERRTQQLLAPDDAFPVLESLAIVREGCLGKKNEKSDWDPVEVHAKRVGSRLRRATSLIPLLEGNVLDLAMQLGHIFHHIDGLPSEQFRKDIQSGVRNALPSTSATQIEQAFAMASEIKEGYRFARRIYTLLDREIRYG